MNSTLQDRFNQQSFTNGYELVDGVAMNAANPEAFLIPPDVIKRHLRPGYFVELRIDSPRFSVHAEDAAECSCPSCSGEMTKPILRHEHPLSLVPLPEQSVPARGWGEDFWVCVIERSGELLSGEVDNHLVESRLHGLSHGDGVVFSLDHVLALHGVHRQEIVSQMNDEDLRELARWLRQRQ